jgi:UDP-glucuronate decarboxylase
MLPDDGRVISNFVVQALSGRALTLHGDGRQSRSFCYVDDMIRGLVALMALDDDDVGPVNLGNPRECTIAEIADRIIAETGATVGVVHEPPLADDPYRRRPDIACARRLLGWEPVVSLEEGLARTVAYFRDSLDASRSSSPSQS